MILFGPVGNPDTPSRMRYQYAECKAGWTNAANWTLTTVATPVETVAMREFDRNRYFAIMPAPSPRRIGARTSPGRCV
jgi:hypothetical protein